MSARSAAPITTASPVSFSDPLPSGVDVVIVGAERDRDDERALSQAGRTVGVCGREGPGGG
nr:hypothetical protein [Hoeflea alexandrii]